METIMWTPMSCAAERNRYPRERTPIIFRLWQKKKRYTHNMPNINTLTANICNQKLMLGNKKPNVPPPRTSGKGNENNGDLVSTSCFAAKTTSSRKSAMMTMKHK